MSLERERDLLTSRALRRRLDPMNPDAGILLDAASIIRQGGVLAYPTETFYGLAADPFNAAAVERLFRLKGRSSQRALILLVARAEQALEVAQVAGVTRIWLEKLSAAFWPGALTLALPARPAVRGPALGGGSTVAVRMSPHPVAWQLCRTAGRPITSTSANPSGDAAASSADQIDPALAAGLDLILDAGPTPGGLASTLLDITGARPVILRQGAITPERIAAVLGVRPMVCVQGAEHPDAGGSAQLA